MAEDKFEYYCMVKRILESKGVSVDEFREINCGLQFGIIFEGSKSLIRIYEGKKGIRLDLSQIRDEEVSEYISQLLSKPNDIDNRPSKVVNQNPNIENINDPEEIVGTDESGKGDYFGPLVIAGVYTNTDTGAQLKLMGVDDSKKLTDAKISLLASKIKELCPYSIVTIGNEKYNELYAKINNLNKLLAWGHARTIENVLNKVQCEFVLSDQFGDPNLIKNALMEKGKNITLLQRPKAEQNIAVAAASIIARDEYVSRLAQLEKKYGISLPKGASSLVVNAGKMFVKSIGFAELRSVSKLHFKTTEQLING